MRIFGQLLKQSLCDTNQASCKRGRLKKYFGKYLLVTNTVLSGLFMGVGDYGAQRIENRKKEVKKIDYARMGNMVIVGAIAGPICHFAYKWIDLLLPVVTLKNVGIKILIDQLIISPICIVQFITCADLLEGKNWDDSFQELKDKAPIMYTGDWLFWPPVQFVNFYYVSGKYRVAYVNGATMLYNVFLAYVKHNTLE